MEQFVKKIKEIIESDLRKSTNRLNFRKVLYYLQKTSNSKDQLKHASLHSLVCW